MLEEVVDVHLVVETLLLVDQVGVVMVHLTLPIMVLLTLVVEVVDQTDQPMVVMVVQVLL
jgi:hypothetical protein